MLARIYGVYTVRMEDQSPVKLVVMENSNEGASHHIACYDLKGSWISRIVKGRVVKPTATLKDLNVLKDKTAQKY